MTSGKKYAGIYYQEFPEKLVIACTLWQFEPTYFDGILVGFKVVLGDAVIRESSSSLNTCLNKLIQEFQPKRICMEDLEQHKRIRPTPILEPLNDISRWREIIESEDWVECELVDDDRTNLLDRDQNRLLTNSAAIALEYLKRRCNPPSAQKRPIGIVL